VKRRTFLGVVGSATAAWPLAVRAQQAGRMRRVGVIVSLTVDDSEGVARVAAFRQALQQLGWTDGRNVQIDIRWSDGDAERIRKNAAI
jgi:putative tryptophan/tyrosine transport system substrate-binding protein